MAPAIQAAGDAVGWGSTQAMPTQLKNQMKYPSRPFCPLSTQIDFPEIRLVVSNAFVPVIITVREKLAGKIADSELCDVLAGCADSWYLEGGHSTKARGYTPGPVNATDDTGQLYRALQDVTDTLVKITRDGDMTIEQVCRMHTNLVGTSIYNARQTLAEFNPNVIR